MKMKTWYKSVRGKIQEKLLIFLCAMIVCGLGSVFVRATLDVNDSSAATTINTIPSGVATGVPSATTGKTFSLTREVDFSDTDYSAAVNSTVTLFTIPAYSIVRDIIVDVTTAEINASYNPTLTICMNDTAVTAAIDAETTATVVALNVGGTYAFPGKAYRTAQTCEADVLVGGLDNAVVRFTVLCEKLPYNE